MKYRRWRYDVMLRIMMLLVLLAMMRCLPQTPAKRHHFRRNHHWRSQHHLPGANIIQKSHFCQKTKVAFLVAEQQGFEPWRRFHALRDFESRLFDQLEYCSITEVLYQHLGEKAIIFCGFYGLVLMRQISWVMVPIGQKLHQVRGLNSTFTARPMMVEVSMML